MIFATIHQCAFVFYTDTQFLNTVELIDLTNLTDLEFVKIL